MAKKILIPFLAAVFLGMIVLAVSPAVRADHHNYGKSGKYGKGAARNQTLDPVYRENCGGCHMAYPPGLLPGRSWSVIMSSLADHHAEAVELEPEVVSEITSYLKNNAADVSRWKRSRRIMSSLGSATPLRVTEVPYLVKKHRGHDFPADAFTRKSVGSMSNCRACHPGAEKGDFDDDRARIPEP